MTVRRIFLNLCTIIIVVGLITLNTTTVDGQNISRKLTVISGGNLPFSFNTLKHYKEGFTYNDWTNLVVFYNDTANYTPGFPGLPGDSDGWEVTVRAQTDFISASGYLPFDLSILKLRVENISIPDDPSTDDIDLSDSDQPIIWNRGSILNVSGSFKISYDFALPPNTVLGFMPDFYTVNLIFTIKPLYD